MRRISMCLFFCALALGACFAAAQQSPQEQPERQRGGSGGREFRGAFGQITEISGSTLKIKLRDGSTGTVNTTAETKFRKEREQAKLSDFKVGDTIAVRGDSSGDKTWTAQVVSSAPSQAQMEERMKAAVGKTMVVGEVKSIDAPKLTILRSDGVEQTIEADENTSFRKGRGESITMPDIKVGDTVFARGELKNNVFVPAAINVVDPEMARRLKEGGGMFVMDRGPRSDRGSQQSDQPQAAPQSAPK
jgi:Cu/Ag efflux protein CusF